ncbi:MAG: hypothetical protein HY344_02335 [Candidatus Levybacteria bacterium]|nr:hypothetical protein [Candidatus Levybacteria bacterium]
MGFLQEGDPARYHLATTESGLDIAVHKKALPKPSDIDTRQASRLARYLKLPGDLVLPSADHEWGFGPVLRQIESPHPDWVLYSCDLPQGQQRNIGKTGVAQSTTLSLLFELLEREGKETDSVVQQHQTVNVMVNGIGVPEGFGLIAHLNPPLLSWLGENMSDPVSEVITDAMIKSFHKMYGSKPSIYDAREFYVDWQESGLLFTSVPRAFFNTARGTVIPGMGYDMTTNNSDFPHQQLSLLVGLAKIEELATGEYFRKAPQA